MRAWAVALKQSSAIAFLMSTYPNVNIEQGSILMLLSKIQIVRLQASLLPLTTYSRFRIRCFRDGFDGSFAAVVIFWFQVFFLIVERIRI